MAQYALYLRKSRADLDAEARGEGETLAKHRRALTEMANRRNLIIAREYAELVSGDTIAARPQMQQLLEDVKAGMYTGVIVNDVDRLGRGDSIDQEIIKITFAASHTLIITPNRDIDPANSSDEDMLDFSMFFARLEYKKIAQRMSVGRYRSAASGNFVTSKTPYGYMRFSENGKHVLVPDPETAPIVRMIFEWYASGEAGFLMIANRLTDMGIRSSENKIFNFMSIRKMLINPVYIGTIVYGRTKTMSVIEDGIRVKKRVNNVSPITTENAHEAIVSRELFDVVQRRFADNNHAVPVNARKKLASPLVGLIRCAICGHVMIDRQKSKNQRYIQCDTTRCQTRNARSSEVEAALLDALRDYAASYIQPDERSTDDKLEQKIVFARQLSTIESRLSRARELVETGVYTPQEYIAQRDTLTAQADTIREQIAAIDTPHQAPVQLPIIKNVLDSYPRAKTPAQKNALLKSVIDHATYTRTGDKLSPFTIDLYPKMQPK